MMDAKRITNFSTKTTSQLLMQNSAHAPTNLQNRSLRSRSSKLADTYRMDIVRASLKQQLTDRNRYGADISRPRNLETGHK